jgi:hypothetical protein
LIFSWKKWRESLKNEKSIFFCVQYSDHLTHGLAWYSQHLKTGWSQVCTVKIRANGHLNTKTIHFIEICVRFLNAPPSCFSH